MRRFLIPALMISLLLGGCGSGASERKVEQRRDALAAAEQMCFRAEITAASEREAFQCTLDCTAAAEGIEIEVVRPELIAGITARMGNGETELSYDGVRLSVGTAGLRGLQPMSAVPLLCTALREGHVIRAWTEKAEEGELVAAEIFADESYGLTLWYDSTALTPLHAELSQDGRVVITCDFSEFQVR